MIHFFKIGDKKMLNEIFDKIEDCLNVLESIKIETGREDIKNVLNDLDENFRSLIDFQRSLGDLIYGEEEEKR